MAGSEFPPVADAATPPPPWSRIRRWSVIVALLLPALFLRLPLANHDVEHYIGPDEAEIVENVLEMLKTGDWDHRHRGYPALNFYLLRGLFSASLRLSSPHLTPDDIPRIDRAFFYRIARTASLVASWLAALIAAGVSLRYGSFVSALVSGILIAYSPLLFRESRVVNPDLMLLFWSSVSIWLTLRAMEEPTRGRFLAAGVAAALSMSVKYTGGALFFVLVLAWWLSRPRRATHLGIALGFGVAIFLVLNPYTLVNASQSSVGLSHHLIYYGASESNAGVELLRLSFWRGMGPVAFVAALASALLQRATPWRIRLVVWSLVVVVVMVFFGFGRAFPRHALILLMPLSILAGWSIGAMCSHGTRHARRGAVTLALLAILPQGFRAAGLSRAASRPSPAERAYEWTIARLPEGARILEDQFTPSFRAERFEVYRFRVEDRVFAGDFDWVMYSGYPPGMSTRRLRPVARFETDDALGAPVEIFQVPDRASLMGTTLTRTDNEVRLRAGQLAFFGSGWSKPQSGAFATSRLSIDSRATMYFVLADPEPVPELELEMSLALATGDEPLRVRLSLNGTALEDFDVDHAAPSLHSLHSSAFRRGLNELTFDFDQTRRMSRRRRSTAIRLFELAIRRIADAETIR